MGAHGVAECAQVSEPHCAREREVGAQRCCKIGRVERRAVGDFSHEKLAKQQKEGGQQVEKRSHLTASQALLYLNNASEFGCRDAESNCSR